MSGAARKSEAAELQQQARALGDPTRHAIFRFVARSLHPTDIAELTAHLGLNHNAIRQHLAKLVAATLVVEGNAPTHGPGRPRLVYEVDPAAESRWGVTGPYERLSHLLAEIIRTGDSPVEVGRRAALKYRITTGTATTPEGVVEDIEHAMAREGFDPRVRRRGDRVDITLRACPFESTAVVDPDTVCSLHLGLAQGLAEGSGISVEELDAKDPRRAGCRLRLRAAE